MGWGWRFVLWSPPVVTLQKVSLPQTSASHHFGLLSIRQNEPGSATSLSDCKAFFIFTFLTPQDKLGGKLCLTFQGNSGVSAIIPDHCACKSEYEVGPCKVFSFLHACSSDQPENITQLYLFTFVYLIWYRYKADYQQMLIFTELENEWLP